MVQMFSFHNRLLGTSLLSFHPLLGVLVLLALVVQAALDFTGVVMLERTVLHRRGLVVMLFWQDFRVLHWLLCGMVMVLVDLAVYGSCLALMLFLRNSLLLNSWSRLFVESCVMFTIPRAAQVSIQRNMS